MQEGTQENDAALVKKVTEEDFRDILKVQVTSIERIHRLGKKTPGRNRPIIFRLADFREKVKILSNCTKLKDTEISISEDYSRRVVEIRKRLWDSCAEERKEGRRAKLVFDKLKMNNVLYGWDEDKKEKSTNELTKVNGELHADISDDEVTADYDSVMEYEEQATGSLGLLGNHILELSIPPTTGTGVRAEPPAIQPTSAMPSGENGPQGENSSRSIRGVQQTVAAARIQSPTDTSVIGNSATGTRFFCEKHHATSECDSSLDHNDKRRLLTASGSCFRCTTKVHRAQDCHRKSKSEDLLLQYDTAVMQYLKDGHAEPIWSVPNAVVITM
ncbi:hypothetical protein HPB49_003430 [Dermacentor silvarum]|uniref:Uncharacterized protein n=1 Tax=Dermacentor silvarum TaxID=543639 RepID=A0ACB8CPI1_DERSI|nr:hypothetical protein HPB49_003430 [Dermacentor silvarum]